MAMIPVEGRQHTQLVVDDGEIRRHRTQIDTPHGALHTSHEVHQGEAFGWVVKPLVENLEQLRMLMEIPWSLTSEGIRQARENYREADGSAARMALRCFLSSPVVCLSGCMDFATFLGVSAADPEWMHENCAEITRRQLAVLEAIWEDGLLDTTICIGGSEQCTPPMMRPTAFDDYVVPYEGQIVGWLKSRGVAVQCHCHGKVRHALRAMVEMGCDATDPVEPPPAGDGSITEARQIVGDQLCLVGNLEWDELCFSDPAHIRERVRQIMSVGPRRLVVSASAAPVSAVDPALVRNYRELVDTVLTG